MSVGTAISVASAAIAAIISARQAGLARLQARSAERQAHAAEEQTRLMADALKADEKAREAEETKAQVATTMRFVTAAQNLCSACAYANQQRRSATAWGVINAMLHIAGPHDEVSELGKKIQQRMEEYQDAKAGLASIVVPPEAIELVNQFEGGLEQIFKGKNVERMEQVEVSRRTISEFRKLMDPD